MIYPITFKGVNVATRPPDFPGDIVKKGWVLYQGERTVA